ncbi:hypothetical protein FAEUMB_06880 [Faecalimonas umbilicata]|uniref:Uncharacterized protein n=2 Tax=Faecalimonas umbilicata TaxID=1912855 RepID=A0ABQ0QUX2_9FIRM|nr:hypothetical protein FAEUMB_06880 [Faecalimonas umbilicata]
MQRYSTGTSFRAFLISGRVFVFNGDDSMTFFEQMVPALSVLLEKNENLHIDRGGFQSSVLVQ